jgi:hypothetical protein
MEAIPIPTEEIIIEIPSDNELQFLDLLAQIITNDIANSTQSDEK